MRWLACCVLAASVAWFPASLTAAWGEEPSPRLELELKLTRKRPEVPVAPEATAAEKAAEEAVAEVERRERDERLIEEVRRAAPPPRPQ
jgi:hypothetical protein